MIYLDTDHVKLSDDGMSVVFLDQSALPNETVFYSTDELQRMYDAIKRLEVRGAPCIGIFAAYCCAVRAKKLWLSGVADAQLLMARVSAEMEYLNESRPTAVNLSWAIERMLSSGENYLENAAGATTASLCEFWEHEAVRIHEEDIAMCMKIAEYGLSLVNDGDGILTHCNAGPLATSRYGTALGPILLGKERGIDLHVFADETRPLLQGARLTSYELYNAGVDVTLICDNMASIVMKSGKVQACFVGCDRIAANGDAANKVGTSGVAILAKHYGIPFYVLGPLSTIDRNCPSGEHITIEERKSDEIKEMFYEKPMALPGVKCYNPAFDVTDHELITAIITDKGILRAPYEESIRKAFEE